MDILPQIGVLNAQLLYMQASYTNFITGISNLYTRLLNKISTSFYAALIKLGF